MIIYYVLLPICALVAFCTRPTLLGEHLSPLAAGAATGLALVFLILHPRGATRLQGSTLVIALASCLFWIYYCIICGVKNFYFDSALKGFVLHLMTVIPFLFIISIADYGNHLMKFIFTIIAVLGYSSAVSTVLLQFVSPDSLTITEMAAKANTEQISRILLPLSTLYHEIDESNELVADAGIAIYRFSCFFREAGICQAFASWALVTCIVLGIRNYWMLGGLLLAFLCSISTSALLSAAFILFAIIYTLRLAITTKILLATVVPIVTVGFVLFTPFIGYMAKKESAADVSFADRADAIRVAWSSGMDTIFGTYGSEIYSDHAGICLLGETMVIGVVGIVLVLAIYFLPVIWLREGRLLGVLAIAPILVTGLLSQPMAYFPLTILAIALTYRSIELMSTRDLDTEEWTSTNDLESQEWMPYELEHR